MPSQISSPCAAEFELAARRGAGENARRTLLNSSWPADAAGHRWPAPQTGPGAEGDQVLQNPLRARPGIVEQRRGSAEPGKEQAVAHAIAEEHLGNRIQPVSRLQCQQLRSERPAETERVAQAVHHPLGAPVEPEVYAGNRLPPGPGDGRHSNRGPQDRPARPARNRRAKGVRRPHAGSTAPRTAQRRCIGFTHHQAGLAVGSDIGQGLLAGLGIDHGGNGADRDAGQEQQASEGESFNASTTRSPGEQAGQLAGLGECRSGIAAG